MSEPAPSQPPRKPFKFPAGKSLVGDTAGRPGNDRPAPPPLPPKRRK